MYLYEAAAQALHELGVRKVFGVLGDANLFIFDHFARLEGTRFYSVSHEGSAVLAAAGYAAATGEVGVATVTHGPALTNTITALTDAARSHTPLLLLAGDTDPIDTQNLQNFPQRDFVLPTGAQFVEIRSEHTVGADLSRAMRLASVTSGPVVVNYSAALQWNKTELSDVVLPLDVQQPVSPAQETLDEALGIIASANRPLVLAGRGARSAEARDAVIALAEQIGAPLATTLRARDLFRTHPHNIGVHGNLAHEVGSDTISQADVLIAFGAGLNSFTTHNDSLIEGKRIVQIDIDPAAIGRNTPVDAGVVGDTAATAVMMAEMLREAELPPSGFASALLADTLAARPWEQFTDRSSATAIDARTALIAIDRAFPEDRTVVVDLGRFMLSAFRHVSVPGPSRYVHTSSTASVGLGMGNAIGAAASGIAPTLLITGDGGFMMGGISEFNAAVRHGLDLVVVVINDSAYGAEHIQLQYRDMDPTATMFDWPDFAPVADALGAKGVTVRNASDLATAIDAIEHRRGPLLIDVKVDPAVLEQFTLMT